MIKDKNEKGFYHGNIENIFRQNQGILRNTAFPPILVNGGGSTVVKVLCYKSEGRWFDPGLCQWIFH